uniref:Uncharacterized protein n=1 Tax=Moschus moschiferus TaxID=68415 RepID=A0A8C6E1G3_MOSMO
MQYASEAKDSELVKSSYSGFCRKKEECSGVCLFACFHLLWSDVILETAWRHSITYFAMLHFIQGNSFNILFTWAFLLPTSFLKNCLILNLL